MASRSPKSQTNNSVSGRRPQCASFLSLCAAITSYLSVCAFGSAAIGNARVNYARLRVLKIGARSEGSHLLRSAYCGTPAVAYSVKFG